MSTANDSFFLYAARPPAVAGALRSGGYVVYFRHTATDFSKNDATMTSYDDCANQRLLSPQGRSQYRLAHHRTQMVFVLDGACAALQGKGI